MNLQEFIESGILESYVTGSATAEERAEVERMAQQHPEVRAELASIEEALEAYAMRHSVRPPEKLKAQIMAQINGPVSKKEEPKVIALEERPRLNYWVGVAAAAVIAAMYMGMQFLELELTIDDWEEKYTAMSDDYRKEKEMRIAYQQQAEESKTALAVLMGPTSKMVCLMGKEKSPDALAHVYWNTRNKEVYLEVNKLPAAPAGMQYQLWAIKDGKPVDAGMIVLTADSLQDLHKMKAIDEAQAFAITLEKEGGSPTPQGDMYVLGQI